MKKIPPIAIFFLILYILILSSHLAALDDIDATIGYVDLELLAGAQILSFFLGAILFHVKSNSTRLKLKQKQFFILLKNGAPGWMKIFFLVNCLYFFVNLGVIVKAKFFSDLLTPQNIIFHYQQLSGPNLFFYACLATAFTGLFNSPLKDQTSAKSPS